MSWNGVCGVCCEDYQSAQQTACAPFHDMLPHLHILNNDVILPSVLTEI